MKFVFNFIYTLAAATAVGGCYRQPDLPASPSAGGDPAEVALGERLFRDGRFSQFFATRSEGDPNAVLDQGDPVLQKSQTRGTPLDGPYSAGGMNCAACHLVDEQLDTPGGGMRAYADFARRSPIPDRDDDHTMTARNTPTMVGVLVPRAGGTFLHFDAQFPSAEALVRGTLTGRNFGWKPNEPADAIAEVARVIRGDDGAGELAAKYGKVPYRAAFVGATYLPAALLIPETFRLDVTKASDDEIFDAVARLIAAYMGSLDFSRDAAADYNGSPYDLFLRKNGLPVHPEAGESPVAYARRLRAAIAALPAVPHFVGPEDGAYKFHDHPFQFGQTELDGLTLFLSEPASAQDRGGNCLGCHPPPAFTDFGFHNTGISQLEYDAAHGTGSFAQLTIPSAATRALDPAKWLPASSALPDGTGVFLSIPDAASPGRADLGLWNVLANPAVPDPQDSLHAALCTQLAPSPCNDDTLLPLTVAAFKTPTLRDLGHTAPYMHDGAFDNIDDAVQHYHDLSQSVRAGAASPNLDSRMLNVRLQDSDTAALAAFLRALDEDYQ
jgi:cytochrome c peroxidase